MNAAASTTPDAPLSAHRELAGVTSGLEARVLRWLAARTPAWIGPDHLTLLGFAGMSLAGAAYAASARWPGLLVLASVGLALNWLGDSLDGTLARYRNRTRPRYGHYVDHVVDGLGAVALLGGLAVSGWITPSVGLGLLVSYLLFLVHMGYAAHTTGRFTMSYQGIGGTELRIALVAVNGVVVVWPTVPLNGVPVLVFDILGASALVAMATLLVRAIWQTATELDLTDRAEWPVPGTPGEAQVPTLATTPVPLPQSPTERARMPPRSRQANCSTDTRETAESQ